MTVLSKSIFGNYSAGNNAMYVSLTQNESTPGKYKINFEITKGTVLSGAIVDDEGEVLQAYVHMSPPPSSFAPRFS